MSEKISKSRVKKISGGFIPFPSTAKSISLGSLSIIYVSNHFNTDPVISPLCIQGTHHRDSS